jgi:flagellar basal-body rod protein FlgB
MDRPPLPSRRSFPPVLFDTTQMALERSISGAAQRQEALAANLANADTPGYQRVDVDFHGALAAAMGAANPGSAVAQTSFTTQADRSVGAVRADGSTVDVDAESAKLAANALDQETAVQVLHARLAIMRSAIGVAS